MNQGDDARLIGRFHEHGDLAAFEALYERHRAALLAFAGRLAGDPTVAEDVSQQTWLKVIDAGRRTGYTPRAGASFRTWLFTLARNHYVDQYRRSAAATRQVELPEDWPEDAEAAAVDPFESIESRELGRRLDAALRALPFEQREVIALWATGMEFDVIQSVVGAPRETVLSRRKYALAKLRAALGVSRS